MKINIKKLSQKGFSHIEGMFVAVAVVAVIGAGLFVYNKNHVSHAATTNGWTTLYPNSGNGQLVSNVSAIACITSRTAILSSMIFIIVDHNSSARTIKVFDLDRNNNTQLSATHSNWNSDVQTFTQYWSPKKGWTVNLQILTGTSAIGGQYWNSFYPNRSFSGSGELNASNIDLCDPGA